MDKKVNRDSDITTLEALVTKMEILKVRIKEFDRQIEVAESEVERLENKRNDVEIRLENLERLYTLEQIDNESSN